MPLLDCIPRDVITNLKPACVLMVGFNLAVPREKRLVNMKVIFVTLIVVKTGYIAEEHFIVKFAATSPGVMKDFGSQKMACIVWSSPIDNNV